MVKNILFASIPQIIGFATFFIVLKLNQGVIEKIPAYQSGLVFFSLGFMALMYQKKILNMSKIFFNFLLILIVSIYLLSISYGLLNNYLFFILVSLLFLATLILTNRDDGKEYYILVSAFFAFSMPMLLIYEHLFLFLVLFSMFINILLKESKDMSPLTFCGKDCLYNLLLHAPLVAIPLFDIYLLKFLGENLYSDYIIVTKLTNAFFLFIFADVQLRIIKKRSLPVLNKYIYPLIFLIISIIVILNFYITNLYALCVLCLLLSLLINISSVVLRLSLIVQEIQVISVAFSILSIFVYYQVINAFSDSNELKYVVFVMISLVYIAPLIFLKKVLTSER